MKNKNNSRSAASPAAAASTPASPEKAKPEIVAQPSWLELADMAATKLFEFGKDIVKSAKAVITAKKKEVENLKLSAKVVAAMKRHYTAQIETHALPADTSFKKYFKDNCGGDLPGRVEAIASLFNALVLTLDGNGKPLLSEENFDNAAADWLEKANAIVTAARKAHGENWKGCDDVLDTINALSKAGDAGKKLTEIRKRQKGETTTATATGESAVVMTPQLAAEYLIAAIKKAGDLPEAQAAGLYQLTVQVNDTWEKSGVSDDTLNKWASNMNHGVAPDITVLKEAPAATETAPAELAVA